MQANLRPSGSHLVTPRLENLLTVGLLLLTTVGKGLPLGVEVGHNVLDSGVILKAILGEVLTVTRVLEAAMWHLRDHRNVGVDPDDAEVKGLRHPHCATVVCCPDA